MLRDKRLNKSFVASIIINVLMLLFVGNSDFMSHVDVMKDLKAQQIRVYKPPIQPPPPPPPAAPTPKQVKKAEPKAPKQEQPKPKPAPVLKPKVLAKAEPKPVSKPEAKAAPKHAAQMAAKTYPVPAARPAPAPVAAAPRPAQTQPRVATEQDQPAPAPAPQISRASRRSDDVAQQEVATAHAPMPVSPALIAPAHAPRTTEPSPFHIAPILVPSHQVTDMTASNGSSSTPVLLPGRHSGRRSDSLADTVATVRTASAFAGSGSGTGTGFGTGTALASGIGLGKGHGGAGHGHGSGIRGSSTGTFGGRGSRGDIMVADASGVSGPVTDTGFGGHGHRGDQVADVNDAGFGNSHAGQGNGPGAGLWATPGLGGASTMKPLKGHGLAGTYFTGRDLTHQVAARQDAEIDFDFFQERPANVPEEFCVRWTGYIKPTYSEAYTFSMISDDGARLYIDGKLLIDDWHEHAKFDNRAQIPLIAGHKHDITVEYFENGWGEAYVQLSWSSASQPLEVIPSSALLIKPE